jgi:hypothetical protein
MHDYANAKTASTCADQQVNKGQSPGGCEGRAVDSYYRPSPAEEAQKAAQYHAEAALKQQMAAAFFNANPAFSEFISLVRQGVIGI